MEPLVVQNKTSSNGFGNQARKKRRKVESLEGHVWGESVGKEEESKEYFLKGREEEKKTAKVNKQSKLVVM